MLDGEKDAIVSFRLLNSEIGNDPYNEDVESLISKRFRLLNSEIGNDP